MRQTVLVNARSAGRRADAPSTEAWVGCTGHPRRDADPEENRRDGGVTVNGPIQTDPSGQVILCGDVLLDNAGELRSSLQMPGASDASLLAALFAKFGPQCIRHARGMYAVAACWPGDRRVTLLRDAVGARNIYYSIRNGAAWFSPRLRTLRTSAHSSSDICLSALRNYLTCAYVPGQETMVQGVLEAPPGAAVSLPDGCVTTVWTPAELERDREETLEAAAERLRNLLEDAVRVCLPQAGPVGVYLSGGLDSSLVTALACRLAAGPVHTYSIHFGEGYRNELEFSSMVAQHCSTHHHVLELPVKLVRERFVESIAALDDPIGDPLTTPNLILGRAAAQETAVILNGEGGDPCFGGPKNLPMLLHELYGTGQRATAYLRSYQKCYDDLAALFTPQVHQELAKLPRQEDMFEAYLGPDSGMRSYLNRLMLMNIRLKGADHILTKVNNLTESSHLLGRSPLFDSRVVETSFAIPPSFKQHGAVEKAVLKRAVADLLPEPVLMRPKSGMMVPVQAWFRKDLRGMARSMLLGRRAHIRPYIRQEVIKEWLNYQGSLMPRHGVKLWLALTLEVWLRENGY